RPAGRDTRRDYALRLRCDRRTDDARNRCNGKYLVPHVQLLCEDARRLAPARNAIQFISCGNVPGTTRIALLQFSASSRALELIEAASIRYRGTKQGDKCKTSIRIPPSAFWRHFDDHH